MFDFMGSMVDMFNNVVVNNNSSGLNHFDDAGEVDLSKIKFVKSPNFDARRNGQKPFSIVMHHTGSTNFNSDIAWLTNKQANASTHYIISQNGEIVQMVSTKDRAWGVGTSYWKFDNGVETHDLNNVSISVEMTNIGMLSQGQDGKYYYNAGRDNKEWTLDMPVYGELVYPDGHKLKGGAVQYPYAQTDAAMRLCKALIKMYPEIKKEYILGHFQVAIPSGRKSDPSFTFNMEDFKNKVFG